MELFNFMQFLPQLPENLRPREREFVHFLFKKSTQKERNMSMSVWNWSAVTLTARDFILTAKKEKNTVIAPLLPPLSKIQKIRRNI